MFAFGVCVSKLITGWFLYLNKLICTDCMPFQRVANHQLRHLKIKNSWQRNTTSVYSAFVHSMIILHDDVIKWKHFPRYWPFVRGIHLSPGNSPHKCQWREGLMFSLIWAWINGRVSNRKAGDLRRNRAHHDITVMIQDFFFLAEMVIRVIANNLNFTHCGLVTPYGDIDKIR